MEPTHSLRAAPSRYYLAVHGGHYAIATSLPEALAELPLAAKAGLPGSPVLVARYRAMSHHHALCRFVLPGHFGSRLVFRHASLATCWSTLVAQYEAGKRPAAVASSLDALRGARHDTTLPLLPPDALPTPAIVIGRALLRAAHDLSSGFTRLATYYEQASHEGRPYAYCQQLGRDHVVATTHSAGTDEGWHG